jgi:hypothetical protein
VQIRMGELEGRQDLEEIIEKKFLSLKKERS